MTHNQAVFIIAYLGHCQILPLYEVHQICYIPLEGWFYAG